MRILRWLLGLVVGLTALAVLAAWLIPPMLDWTRYRGEIVALASGTLGRSVRIDGPISLTLLPQPVLTAASVSVDEGEAAITVRVLRLRVALWPLLRGRVAAQELVMRDFDMRVPWPISTPSEAVQRPEWLAATSARIEHGRVAIGDLAFTDIDADLTTGAASGGYAASGTARLSGRPWHVSMRMTPPGGDGSVGLDVALDGQGPVQGIGATLAGQIDGDGTLGGRVTARGPDLSMLLPAPAVAFKADGRLTVAGGLAAADDLTVEIGGSPARGAVALRVSPALRLDVALAASRLDLDAWLPMVLNGGGGDGGVSVPTGIDLSAEAAQLAGGTVRRLRGAFDIGRGGVEVRDIRAVLPGEAAVQLSGRITHPAPARPHFEGKATLAAPALRTTLAWLEGAGLGGFSALPEGVFRSTELAGHVTLDPGRLGVDALSGQVDGVKLGGALAIRPGKRLALTAALRTERIDLDRWLPASWPALSVWQGGFGAVDADVKLEAGEASLRGVAIRPFALDAKIDAGQITLRRLEGRARDVQVIASGVLVEGGRIADGRLDVQTPQATNLADLLPDGLRGRFPALLRAAATAQVQASGPLDALGLRIAADLGDLRLEAQPVLDLASGKWAGPMTLRHPGAPRLAEMLGLSGAPAWLGDGSLALVARIGGEAGHVAADEFDITAGALHATGKLALDRGGAGPRLSGRISAETLPLPLPYLRAPDPLPLQVLDGWSASVAIEAGRVLAGASPMLDGMSATLVLADRALRLERMTARLGGGEVTGTLGLSAGGAAPSVSANLTAKGVAISGAVFDLPVDIVGGTLDGTLAMTATGFSPAALLATLRGDLALTLRDGQIAGFEMAGLIGDAQDDALRTALAGGTTPFETLSLAATAERGNLVLRATRLVAPSGEAVVTGSINLPAASADLRLAIRPAIPDPPEIGLRLTGPLDALRRTPELADVTRWRLARVAPPSP
jgi:hypothetical protein